MSGPFSARDHALMARALRLAARGLATTQPNPCVGCVVDRDGEVVGEGWHRRAGEAHAEILALGAAGARARGATAYVTLEPCGLHGRTPPCADALIEAGVARVVIAAEDASQHTGCAPARLRAAGIAVESGLMREAARELDRGFFRRIETGRPWLRVKLALSLDGRTALAAGESKWISGEAARRDVQRWRARSSALLTGIGTVLADDPRLTVRSSADSVQTTAASAEAAFVPTRVLLDPTLRTPSSARVLDGSAPTLVLHAPGARVADARFARVECAQADAAPGGLDLAGVMRQLAARGMNEVQVEAGATLSGALFEAGLVDELLLYVAPALLGDTARPLLALPPLASMAGRRRLRIVDQRQVGEDIRLLLRPAPALHADGG